jgi:hypothetical protein
VAGAAQNFRRVEPQVPTAEELKAAGSAGYNAARDMGVDFRSRAVADMAATVRAGLEADGVLNELAPKSFSILSKLESPPANSVAPLSGLDAARKALRNAAQDFSNPTERLAASRIISALDRFTENPDPAAVVAGPAVSAGERLAAARGDYAAAKRSEQLAGIGDAADLRAASANSGRNLDNATRQRIASLLLKPKARAGYSPEEIAAIEKISTGNWGRNRVRDVGNLFGGGGGLGQMLTTAAGAVPGVMVGSPEAAGVGAVAAPMVGVGAKSLANALTRRALERADELVRQRSPLYRARGAAAPSEAAPTAGREAILKALLLQLQSQRAGGGGY